MWLSKKVHWQYVSHHTTNTGGWMPNSFEPFMWSVHHLAINIAVIVNCPLSTEKSLNRLKHREPFSRIINRTELQRYYQIKPKLPYCRAYVCVCVYDLCMYPMDCNGMPCQKDIGHSANTFAFCFKKIHAFWHKIPNHTHKRTHRQSNE